MEKIIIAIGGGEIKSKTTLKIDEYIAKLAKLNFSEEEAEKLFAEAAENARARFTQLKKLEAFYSPSP